MTYFEVAIQIETDESLNQVNSRILAALYAADIDAAGVQVEEFETTPVYEVSADEFMGIDYDEVRTFGSNEVLRYPTYAPAQEDYLLVEVPGNRPVAVGDEVRIVGRSVPETLADVPEDSYTGSLIEALKTNGDRYHG